MTSTQARWNKLFPKTDPECTKKYFETLMNKRKYDCTDCYSLFVLELASLIGKPFIETDLDVLIDRVTALWRHYFKIVSNCKHMNYPHDHESSGSEEECECKIDPPEKCFGCFYEFYLDSFVTYLEDVYFTHYDETIWAEFYFDTFEKLEQCGQCLWD